MHRKACAERYLLEEVFALGFRESSRVPFSELTGVLPGSLLKKEPSNTSAQ